MDKDIHAKRVTPTAAHLQSDFLKQQLITYMGNKRKLLPHIDDVITHVHQQIEKETGRNGISFADPFSGSGVVARLALVSGRVTHIVANDLAHYAHACNMCYLRTPSVSDRERIHALVDQANALPDPPVEEQWVATHWAPADDAHILEGERCYFTRENALRIDAMRNFIDSDAVPGDLKPYLLAPLLSQASIHNNTNGQFAAFYKDADGVGAFGGKKAVDLKRITERIALPYPAFAGCSTQRTQVVPPTRQGQAAPLAQRTQVVPPTRQGQAAPLANHCFHDNTETTSNLTRKDAIQWSRDMAENGETVDLLYLDPPYNKHPYSIYYFLLDIIAKWDKTIDIPDSYRGQPKTWVRSPFNSSVDAARALRTMIADTPARFVALSYYDAGILTVEEIDLLMAEYGDVERHAIQHNVYKRLHGLGTYKRVETTTGTDDCGAKEYLWVLRRK
jgi:adenine-specific DNA-methyltransferase